MRIQGGGGGGGSIPGLTSDNQTPGGIIVAGSLTAGDPAAETIPSFSRINGYILIEDAPGNIADGDPILDVRQFNAVTVDGFGAEAVLIRRSGSVLDADYGHPAARIVDSSNSAQPALDVIKNGVQFQVDGDGVVIYGKFKTGSSTPHVLGSYSGNAVPIYDETGTLLGYMPLYA